MIVKAEIKLRELNTQGLGHVDSISDDDRSWWERWFDILRQLNAVEIPRCLFPNEKDIVRTEIHGFGDASEEAHAAVVYLRHLFKSGKVVIRQVRATTKLAPKKTIFIPKLELNAALQVARLMKAVEGALTRKVQRRYLWTDSSTVRNWIRASASKYQVYVSHRVGEIQTLTEPNEWRFVPGRLNPADVATRSSLEEEALPSKWWEGPDFLRCPEEEWPKDLPWMVVLEEVRPVRMLQTTVSSGWSDPTGQTSRKSKATVWRATSTHSSSKTCLHRQYRESIPSISEACRDRLSAELHSTTFLDPWGSITGEEMPSGVRGVQAGAYETRSSDDGRFAISKTGRWISTLHENGV
jgi:hypothetical protein